MDYIKTAEEILALCGDVKNISSVTHCATRLRLFIIDKSEVKLDDLKKIKGVLGTVYSGDELQIVLGKNLIPVYNEVQKRHDGSGKKEEKAKPVSTEQLSKKEKIKSLGGRLIGFVSAAVTPMIPGAVMRYVKNISAPDHFGMGAF